MKERSLSWHSTLCMYMGFESNQVVALYLIELLLREENTSITFISFYKKIGEEYDYCNNIEEDYIFESETRICRENFEIVNSEDFEVIYSLYESWLNEAERIGLGNMKKKQINPLEGSPYKWVDD